MVKKDLQLCLVGHTGRLGMSILKLLKKSASVEVSAVANSKGVFNTNTDYQEQVSTIPPVDVVLYVAKPTSLSLWIEHCIQQESCLVVGSTALLEKDHQALREASKRIPILLASNFSIAATLVEAAIKTYFAKFSHNAYVDIVEKHHSKKLDAPSGTAKEFQRAFLPVKGQVKDNGKREIYEIPIHSIRGQDHSLCHEVKMDFPFESLELRHTCFNRQAYAEGAIKAVMWITQQPNGLYSMGDVLKHPLNSTTVV